MKPVWLTRLAAVFRKDRLDRELEEDIQEHLRMAVEENLRLGMSPLEAEQEARRSFGGVEQIKEEFRDQRGIPPLETFLRETRFAIRSLSRAPGFSLLAILTLALAIGANSAIFSAVNALLFHPAGITDAGGIAVVRAKYDKLHLQNLVVSIDNFQQVAKSREIFASAAIAKTGSFTYTGGEYPQRLSALRVSAKWFDVFGVRPAQGRLFTEDEDQPGNNQVAALSDAGWKRVFGGDPSILGKSVALDGRMYKVIGILPRSYAAADNELGGRSSSPADLFVPLGVRAETPPVKFLEAFLGVARLRRGVSFEQAQAFMQVLVSRGSQDPLAGRLRAANGWGLSIVPYTDFSGGDMKTPLLILWGAVAFVLVIACSNIAGLMLARISSRSREFAVRTALGGGRWHLLRQLFAESALLALGGSALGLGVAYVILKAVHAFGPQSVTGGLEIPFDLRILLFTIAAGSFAAALFGIAPAAQLGRANTSEALKEGGRSGTPGRGKLRVRSVLVTAEVALALILSIGAGLLVRSLTRLQHVDVGFQPAGVMSAQVSLTEERYQQPARQIAFFRGVLERLSALPGVQSAAAAYPAPFGWGSETQPFEVQGRQSRADEPVLTARLRWVTPGFFATLRIPVRRGRVFTENDRSGSEPVVVIDENLARQYWPDADPLGQKITIQGGAEGTIVGIAGSAKESSLAALSEKGVVYLPMYQHPIPFAMFLAYSPSSPMINTAAIRTAVNSADPAQSLFDAKSMEERVSATLAGRRFTVALLGLFAVTAMFLAALGLYGVINYGVSQRTQEIGIRMALGAQRIQVLNLIVGKGLRITLAGLALGALAAFAIARLLPDELFGVSAFDPSTFASMAALLAAVALFASYVPARRATRLDPLEACRYE